MYRLDRVRHRGRPLRTGAPWVASVIPSPFNELLGAAVFVAGVYLMRLGRRLSKGTA